MNYYYYRIRERWREWVRYRRRLGQQLRRRAVHRDNEPAAAPKKQLVICGYPRSGTTLLYNLCCSTLPDFAYERFEEKGARSLLLYDDCISKRPFDVFELATLAKANVHGKQLGVVVCVRDPRDMIVSQHAQAPDVYFMGWEHSLHMPRLAVRGEYSFSAPGIAQLAQAVRQAEQLPHLNLLRVRYEDLIANPDAVQEKISQRLGFPFAGRFSAFGNRVASQGIDYSGRHAPVDASLVKINQPMSSAYLARWRQPEHRERVVSQFTQHPQLHDLLAEYGYATDRQWLDDLKPP